MSTRRYVVAGVAATGLALAFASASPTAGADLREVRGRHPLRRAAQRGSRSTTFGDWYVVSSSVPGVDGGSGTLKGDSRTCTLDEGSGGPANDFTNRNTTFMTWNVLHLARMLKDAGGLPAHGNQRSLWDAGCRFDFANPDYR